MDHIFRIFFLSIFIDPIISLSHVAVKISSHRIPRRILFITVSSQIFLFSAPFLKKMPADLLLNILIINNLLVLIRQFQFMLQISSSFLRLHRLYCKIISSIIWWHFSILVFVPQKNYFLVVFFFYQIKFLLVFSIILILTILCSLQLIFITSSFCLSLLIKINRSYILPFISLYFNIFTWT
jgi:hypothetical protein